MKNNTIDYVEFKAHNLQEVKDFYSTVFSWTFTDYGENYVAFSDSGLSGGFELTTDPIINGVLVVLFHDNLEEIQTAIEKNGGKIVIPIFEFPGGKRFQFLDPSGNELAVWTDK